MSPPPRPPLLLPHPFCPQRPGSSPAAGVLTLHLPLLLLPLDVHGEMAGTPHPPCQTHREGKGLDCRWWAREVKLSRHIWMDFSCLSVPPPCSGLLSRNSRFLMMTGSISVCLAPCVPLSPLFSDHISPSLLSLYVFVFLCLSLWCLSPFF